MTRMTSRASDRPQDQGWSGIFVAELSGYL